MQHLVRFLLVALTGCGVAVGVPSDGGPDADVPVLDAVVELPIDAVPARCDPAAPFSAPVLVGRLDSAFDEASLTLTRNERIALVGRENTGSPATMILSSTRATPEANFDMPTPAGLEQLNAVAGTEHHPSLTGNGLRVYFERRAGDAGIFGAMRGDLTSAFAGGSAVTIEGVALTGATSPVIATNGDTLYWVDTTTSLLQAAPRIGGALRFGAAVAASTAAIADPVLSEDALALYYSEIGEILVSTRTSTTEPFAPGTAVAEVNSTEQDAPLVVTGDGCVLFLASQRSGGIGGSDIWRAQRP